MRLVPTPSMAAILISAISVGVGLASVNLAKAQVTMPSTGPSVIRGGEVAVSPLTIGKANPRVVAENLLSKTYSADPSGDPQVYGYGENIALSLARGFDPRDVSKYKIPCIVDTKVKLDSGAVKSDLKITYVKNRDQLNFSMHVDAKADAAFLTAKGSAKYSFDTSYAFDSNSITVVMTGSSDYGRWGLGNDADLSATAKALLADGARFAETCGTRFVVAERRGASVSVVITLRSMSSELKASFESEFGGSGGWGQLSASARTKFSTAFRYANAQSRAEVQVGATGGAGLSGLKAGVEAINLDEKDPLGQVFKSLSGFLDGFTEANASPVEYYVASMSLWGWDPNSIDPWTDAKERNLREIVATYRRAVVDQEIIQSLKNGSSLLLKIIDKKEVDRLISYENSNNQSVNDLADAHKKCKADLNTVACDIPRPVSLDTDYLLDILRPPTIVFYMYGFDHQKSSLILNTVKGRRLAVAQSFQPGLSGIAAILSPSWSPGLVAYRAVFAYSDGTEKVADWVGTKDFGLLWFEEPSSGYPAWEDANWRFFAQHVGEFSGTAAFDIEDRTGRRFRVPYYRAKWKAGGGKIQAIETETLF
ncbi:hypothetical protein [Bosea sp. 2RAB26]|uniref:hypothetical protein n=1 Tax=Bosea sp. 2RAB26 TaxID=3237476 RepID=UPI003F8D9890